MDALGERVRQILVETVISACVDYVRHRFPEKSEVEFPRFDSILFAPEYTLSSEREIFDGVLPLTSKYSGGCEPVYENGEAKIGLTLNLDSVFKSLEENEEITRESFEDFVVQILFHEVMHALSANFYLSDGEKRSAIAKWLCFLEEIGETPDFPDWSEISTRFGYSCSFVGASMGGESAYRSFPEINEINEALTDVFAARAYARYRKGSGLPPERYVFGYPLQAKALHEALVEFCRENGYDFDETFRMLELGYFFGDDEYLDAFENVVWAVVNPFSLRLDELSRFGIGMKTHTMEGI